MTDLIIPDSIEPIIGWRAWRVRTIGKPTLASIISRQDWPHCERLEAGCHRMYSTAYHGWARAPMLERHPGEPAPYQPCTCGVHALESEDEILHKARAWNAQCIGRVALWGKVIEGEKGWRAQYAYPVELWLMSVASMWSNEAVEGLAGAYGVPVNRFQP